MNRCKCGCGAWVKKSYVLGHNKKGYEPPNKGKKYERNCYECGKNRIIKGRGRCSGCYKRMLKTGLPNDYTGVTNQGSFKTGHKSWNEGLEVPEDVKLALSIMNTGEFNPNWKGKSVRSHHWYRKEWIRQGGRALKSGEVIHHVDGDHNNNDIKNMKVFSSHSEHMKFHWKQQKKRGVKGRMKKSGKVMTDC